MKSTAGLLLQADGHCASKYLQLLKYKICMRVFYSITRTFASGKAEKMVMQCLKDLGFAGGKVQLSVITFFQ